MDDGYPLEKTPSKESRTCGRRQAEHEPWGHGPKDLLQETRSQKRGRKSSELGEERKVLIFNCNLYKSLKRGWNMIVIYLQDHPVTFYYQEALSFLCCILLLTKCITLIAVLLVQTENEMQLTLCNCGLPHDLSWYIGIIIISTKIKVLLNKKHK